MLGSFLEISVYSPNVLESLGFYERLGFSQVVTNDTWTHPYGVVTDGRCFIGIHAHEFPGPSLTFVAPELRKRVESLEAAVVEFEFLKLADDQFHELGFLAPDDQMVTLLEARTFSPPAPGLPESLLGFFVEYRIPVENRDAAVAHWLRLGMIEGEPADTFHDTATVCCSGLNIGLGESPRLKKPVLVFHVIDLPAHLARLEQRGITTQTSGTEKSRPSVAHLVAPEGTRLLLLEDG